MYLAGLLNVEQLGVGRNIMREAVSCRAGIETIRTAPRMTNITIHENTHLIPSVLLLCPGSVNIGTRT